MELVVPSPKFHSQVAILPVEVSVKLMVNGAVPKETLSVKLAAGTL